MRCARVTAIFGGILLAAALAGEATAAEGDLEDTRPALIEDAGPIGSSVALVDLDKLRARGTGDSESTSRAREAIGPILRIFLLRQDRFADGIELRPPIAIR